MPGAARRLHTFLASPRKVYPPARSVPAGHSVLRTGHGEKRRRLPSTAPNGVPCAARRAGRLRNSRDPLRGHALRQSSPTSPGPAVLLGGGSRGWNSKTKPPHPALPSREGIKIKYGLRPQDQIPPLHRLGFPKRSGAVGEDCLSAKREFRSRPIFSENRGQPEGPVRRGALLFGYLYFGQAK